MCEVLLATRKKDTLTTRTFNVNSLSGIFWQIISLITDINNYGKENKGVHWNKSIENTSMLISPHLTCFPTHENMLKHLVVLNSRLMTFKNRVYFYLKPLGLFLSSFTAFTIQSVDVMTDRSCMF